MPPEPVDFDLGQVFDIVSRMVAPLADEKGIELVVVAPRPEVAMHTDRGQLEQILLNLMGNAVKFAAGGVVDMSASIAGGVVGIAVSDEGPGIADTDQEAVFDEFRQLARPDVVKPQGTGLGLAISRRLARGLGGDIELTSEEGHGATFTVTIPVVLPEGEELRGGTHGMQERDATAGEVCDPAAPTLWPVQRVLGTVVGHHGSRPGSPDDGEAS